MGTRKRWTVELSFEEGSGGPVLKYVEVTQDDDPVEVTVLESEGELDESGVDEVAEALLRRDERYPRFRAYRMAGLSTEQAFRLMGA